MNDPFPFAGAVELVPVALLLTVVWVVVYWFFFERGR